MFCISNQTSIHSFVLVSICLFALPGLVGHVARTGQPVNVLDAYADPRFYPNVDMATGYRTKTLLAMPLLDRDQRVLGVVQFINKSAGAFTTEDEDLLHAFCAQASVALQNVYLYEAERANRQRHATLLAVTQQTNHCVDSHELIHFILDAGKKLLDADIVSMFLVSDDRTMLSKYNVGAGETVSFPISVGIGGFVARSGQLVNIPDCYKDSRFSPFMDKKTGYHTHSMLCVPVFGPNNETVAVIQLINKVQCYCEFLVGW